MHFRAPSIVGSLVLALGLSACTITPVTTTKQNGSGAPSQTQTGEEPGAAPSPSSGSVPADFVGEWWSTDSRISYVIGGDGAYEETKGMATPGACEMVYTWHIEGTLDVGDGVMTFNETSGTMLTKSCSGSETEKSIVPETKQRSWALEGGVLFVWGDDCSAANKETCAIQFEKR